MKRYFLLSLLLCLSACDPFEPQSPAPQPTLTLQASIAEGEAPLPVTFRATLEPVTTGAYRWTVGADVLEETSSTLSYTFNRPGFYIVRAEAAGASASVNVAVSGDPDTEPAPTELELTHTPFGPAPWGVTYTVTPAREGLLARCTERARYNRVLEGRFSCLHVPGDRAEVQFVDSSGEVGVRAELTPDIPENDGVAFAGRWRYSSRGSSDTFTISEGDETSGRSADGRHRLFILRQGGETIAEFTFSGRTVVLEPIPEADGRQVFSAPVYDLRLEALPATAP